MDQNKKAELKTWLREIRRDIHQHPETAYEEVRTTGKIKDILDDLGIQNKTFDDVTGVLGLVANQSQGPTLAVRADIDALPMEEKTGAPYQSQTPGKMHACGHDANITIMLGVAKLLADNGELEKIPGNLKFIFQPAEEGGAGAQRLMDRGVLKDPDVDWIIAGHASPDLAVGTAGFYHKQSHASSDRFSLVIKGTGAHGARPHQGNDPLVPAAQFINSVNAMVARNVDALETAVVTVGKLRAGTTANVLPDKVEMEGTIRALEPEIRTLVRRRLNEICQGLELSFGVKCELNISDGYPPCVGNEDVSEFMFNTAAKVLGQDNVFWFPPTTGGEDFAFYTQEVKGSICRIGCRNEEKGMIHPLHSPYFDLDEEMLVHGVEFFHRCVLDYFKM
jgi:amidohydrolase